LISINKPTEKLRGLTGVDPELKPTPANRIPACCCRLLGIFVFQSPLSKLRLIQNKKSQHLAVWDSA